MTSFTSWGLSLLIVGNAFAGNILIIEKSKAWVKFMAMGNPSAIRVNGTAASSDALTGSIQFSDISVTGKIKLLLAKLETGVALRDQHMKEKYLDVSKYPEATLDIEGLTLAKSFSTEFLSAVEIPFVGSLSLHGKKVSVAGKADITKKKDTILVQLRFPVKLSDFAIEVPKYMGVTVANDVEVSGLVSGQLVD